MDGRSITLLLAATFAMTSLAGCIENPLQAMTAETEVSAFENKDIADAAALEWNKGAVLVGVITFELSETPDPRIESDPEVGNGLAPAWWYVYCAEETSTVATEKEVATGASDGDETKMSTIPSMRAYKVLADGTLSSEDDAAMMAEGFEHDSEALVGWEIDSEAMIASAKQNETFRRVAEGFNATVVEGVASHEGKTAWFASAMSADGWVVATLDAKTGEVLEMEELSFDFAMPTFEFGATGPAAWAAEPVHLEGEGSANAGEDFAEFPFTTTGPMHGAMTLDYSVAFPGDGVHWAILDAEGEMVEGDHLGSWMGERGSYEMELEIEDAGDYTLVIGYMSSVPTPGPGLPLGGAAEYSFVLDLMPGAMPEHEEDDG